MTWPAVGSIGNQWTHPTLESDPDMYSKIDVQLNALAAALGALPGSLTKLRVVARASVTTTVAAPLPFDTVLNDTASGWNATTHQYVVPAGGGLFMCGFVIATTGARISCGLAGIDSGLYGAGQLVAENGTQGSCILPPTPVLFSGGESIYVYPYNVASTLAAFSGPIDTCLFSIDQIGYL